MGRTIREGTCARVELLAGGNISRTLLRVGLAMLIAFFLKAAPVPTNRHFNKAEQARSEQSVSTAVQKPTPEPQKPLEERPQAVLTPPPVEPQPPASSCEAEIRKYNWRQDVALAVAKAESGLRPNAHNYSDVTKDNSWGCFQINIYGANARTRPPASELVKPEVNVAFAYRIYVGNGHSFIGQWGVCRKISCY